MTHQDFDPRLKEAMAKIEAICKEYEVGYLCILANREFTEYKVEFPKWSLIQFDRDKGGIRFQTKKLKPELTNSSFHVFYSIRDVAGMIFVKFQEAAEVIGQTIEIDHNPFGGKKFF